MPKFWCHCATPKHWQIFTKFDQKGFCAKPPTWAKVEVATIKFSNLWGGCNTLLCTLHKQSLLKKKKALLSMMLQCLMVLKTKFQHSVTTTFFFARFFVLALSLWPFYKNLIKFRIFGFFFLGAKDEHQTTNQPEISFLSWKNSNWSPKVASRSLWLWHNVKNSSFWVAQEIQRGKRGGGMITGVGGNPQPKPMKMFSVWDKRCGAIAILLLEW